MRCVLRAVNVFEFSRLYHLEHVVFKFLNSSTGGGFLADLKPYVSLVLLIVLGLRKK